MTDVVLFHVVASMVAVANAAAAAAAVAVAVVVVVVCEVRAFAAV